MSLGFGLSLLLSLHAPAFADGGKGGDAHRGNLPGGAGLGGPGGADGLPGVAGNSATADSGGGGGGGGGGGAGGATGGPGGAGAFVFHSTDHGGDGGAGGTGGLNALTASQIDNGAALTGRVGQTGGAGASGVGGMFSGVDGGGGGGGGAGGHALVVTGGGASSNSAALTGGFGSSGGTGGPTPESAGGNGGNGGDGGAGLTLGGPGVSFTNTGTIKGGPGGVGGIGGSSTRGAAGFGGAGGAGGVGVLVTGAQATLVNSQLIQGGNGDRGGTAGGGSTPQDGAGGAGGVGVSGAGFTLVNSGTIAGGGGPAPQASGAAGAGGAGVSGAGLTVINSGTISGGLAAGGVGPRANAVAFTGGVNVLEIRAGASFGGNVVAFGAADTLRLGGSAAASFDVTQIGTQYLGFGLFRKVGTSTWTLTGANAGVTPWSIDQGTLAIAADVSLGNVGSGLSLNGGTLQTTAIISTARAVTLNAGGGTFQTDADLTLSGAISGAGSLTKTGAGVLTLSGPGSYAGSTTVMAGVLRAGVAGALPSHTAFVLAGGTVDLGGFDLIISSLSGSSGTLALGNAALTIDQSGDTSFAGAIGGAGSLTKSGSGTLILAGASNYTGPTSVNGGILDVNGSLVSGVTVNAGGTLKGNGQVGGLAVMGGGIVAPGNSIGTLNVSGNVAFAAGSTYEVEINAANQGDRITASGKATLSGGTVQVTAAPGTYTQANSYTVLSAAGGVTGRFAALGVSANLASLAFLAPKLTYDASTVVLGFDLVTVPNPPAPPHRPGHRPAGTPIAFASVALTRNQASTATAIQALGLGNPVYNAVVGQTVPGARQAFDALSGEIHASAVTAAFEDSRLPREAILDRLSQAAEPPLLGAATMMMGAYAADLPSHKGPALAPVEVRLAQPHFFGLWGQGFGDWGRTGSDHNAAKITRETGGFVIGLDAERQLFDGLWRFGVAGGYTDDHLKASLRNASGDYQSIFGALYGKASYGAVSLKAGAILASTDTHTSRAILFPGFNDAASASYGGYAAQGFAELGYTLPFHGTLWSYLPGLESLRVNYEPFLQGALIHIDQDRYVERTLNPAAALIGAAKGYDLGTTTLGLRTQYRLASLPGFTLSTLLGWRHAFGDVRPGVTQSFAGSFSSFTVSGVPVDRDALVSETSLDYALSQMVTVGASYSSQLGRRASDNAFKGHVDISF